MLPGAGYATVIQNVLGVTAQPQAVSYDAEVERMLINGRGR
jgi:hypothetical protein